MVIKQTRAGTVKAEGCGVPTRTHLRQLVAKTVQFQNLQVTYFAPNEEA